MNTDTDRLEFMLQYEAEVFGCNEKYNCAWYDGAGNTCRTPEDVIYTTSREAIDAAIQAATNEAIDAAMDRITELKTKEATPEPVKESKINTEQIFSPSIEATDELTLRDRLAIAALQGDLAARPPGYMHNTVEAASEYAYKLADAMMKVRKNEQTN